MGFWLFLDLGTLADASPLRVDSAIAAAREAVDGGRWSGLPRGVRSNLIGRLVDLLEENADSVLATAPFGGVKPSGVGRELGQWGLSDYLDSRRNLKSVTRPREVCRGALKVRVQDLPQ